MTNRTKLSKETIESNYSDNKHYDLIIIGAGISGLSTGLMWQKNTKNQKTLIIEKNSYNFFLILLT